MKHDSDILKRIKTYFMRRKVAEDAYAFERELEADPFLYEAIEGFEDLHVSDIQQALDELDDRLDQKSKKRFAINWRVAASVAGIIAVGAATYTVFNQPTDDVAVETVEKAQSTEEETTTYKVYRPRYLESTYSLLEAPEQPAKESVDSTTTAETIADIAIDERIPDEELNRPADMEPFIEVEKREQRESPELAASESAPTPLEDEIDLAVSEGQLMDEEQGTLELEVQETALKRVAIQNLESKNETTVASTPASAAPKNGMASYKAYLSGNLKKTSEMPRGTVIVSFEFDKNGNPRKVKVENSLCGSCDKEAIRLIENGPSWVAPDRKQRVTMEVKFQ